MSVVRAISDTGQRRQEHGRIRTGVKTAKAMAALKTFRFTSPDRAAIEKLASVYGGEARPWSDTKANPQHQFEVITEASSIRVLLPPEAITCWYEQWTGAGCVRRCDGVTAQLLTKNPHEPHVEAPCVCKKNNLMECRPQTRLSVLLPEVSLGGVWRLDTKSWNALEEMPAMEKTLSQLQAYGVLEARLSLVEQSKQGGSRRFIVPKLELGVSIDELTAGAGQVGAGQRPAIGPGTTFSGPAAPAVGPAPDWYEQPREPEDGVIEAEIVGEGEASHPVASPSSTQAPGEGRRKYLHATLRDIANVHILDVDVLRHGAVKRLTKGRTESSNDLTDDELGQLLDVLDDVVVGLRDVVLEEDGTVRFPPKGDMEK